MFNRKNDYVILETLVCKLLVIHREFGGFKNLEPANFRGFFAAYVKARLIMDFILGRIRRSSAAVSRLDNWGSNFYL